MGFGLHRQLPLARSNIISIRVIDRSSRYFVHPLLEDVLGRVEVAVYLMAIRADPFSVAQRKSLIDPSAFVARPAGWKETTDLHDKLVVPSGLVLKYANEFAPRGIANSFGQLSIADHTLHVEALNTNDVIFPH